MSVLTSISANRIAQLPDSFERNDHGPLRNVYRLRATRPRPAVAYPRMYPSLETFATLNTVKHLILKNQLIHATRLP